LAEELLNMQLFG